MSPSPRRSAPTEKSPFGITRRVAPKAALVLALAAVWSPGGSSATERLRADPRAATSAPPRSLADVAARFLPSMLLDGALGSGTLLRGQVREVLREVEAGQRFGFVAFSPSGSDLDLQVRWVESGELVAQDLAADSYPVVTWTAPRDGRISVQVVQQGAGGDVGSGIFVDRETPARAAGVRDELEARWFDLSARTFSRWWEAGPPMEVRFDRPGVREVAATVAAGECVGWGAVGAATVLDVDLQLVDADRVERARDTRRGSSGAVLHCSDRPAALTLRVAVTDGAGIVRIHRVTHPPEP
jgi:hypothetical protein